MLRKHPPPPINQSEDPLEDWRSPKTIWKHFLYLQIRVFCRKSFGARYLGRIEPALSTCMIISLILGWVAWTARYDYPLLFHVGGILTYLYVMMGVMMIQMCISQIRLLTSNSHYEDLQGVSVFIPLVPKQNSRESTRAVRIFDFMFFTAIIRKVFNTPVKRKFAAGIIYEPIFFKLLGLLLLTYHPGEPTLDTGCFALIRSFHWQSLGWLLIVSSFFSGAADFEKFKSHQRAKNLSGTVTMRKEEKGWGS